MPLLGLHFFKNGKASNSLLKDSSFQDEGQQLSKCTTTLKEFSTLLALLFKCESNIPDVDYNKIHTCKLLPSFL